MFKRVLISYEKKVEIIFNFKGKSYYSNIILFVKCSLSFFIKGNSQFINIILKATFDV